MNRSSAAAASRRSKQRSADNWRKTGCACYGARWPQAYWQRLAAFRWAGKGPSIQLGGMCGKGFGQLFHRVKIEQRYLITCGAAAGLSAAFNAPLAGIMFALEELHRSFSMSVIVSVMIASVTGDFLSQYVFGLAPAFHFDVAQTLPLHLYLIVVLLGILCGVMGRMLQFHHAKGTGLVCAHPIS